MLLSLCLLLSVTPAAAEPVVGGLQNPRAVVSGGDGRIYVAVAGTVGKDGDGAILVVNKGQATPFASGLDDPQGLAAHTDSLYVTDKQRILRIDRQGKSTVYAAATAFPKPPQALRGLCVDPESGTLYVADGATIYRINKGKPSVVTDAQRWPELKQPSALCTDGASFLLVVDGGTLYRLKYADGSREKLLDGLGNGDGLTWDLFGRLYFSDSTAGRVRVLPRPDAKPVVLGEGGPAGALALDSTGRKLLVVDGKAGTLSAYPTQVPGAAVDETPLPLNTAVAFPKLQWAGWQAENDKGQLVALRPLVLTHAGDGSNRVFVATQHGVIHVFPNDQKATASQVFIDLQDRVVYNDKTNEEGFLGLAFHPRFKETGEFFVFYTMKKAKLTNIVSKFRVRKDDPTRGDPDSEEELIRFTKPFWNHDGGTICFGPDGYLYITHGDGGAANDPFDNGQNLKTHLGKVLRIDVDHREKGLNYAIPRDNPFISQSEARPEIWAYGVRNLWRMSFDRETGKLWAGDVGQNLWEEINILKSGGNYGWNRREGLHPFGAKGVGPRKDLIDPIWEYHHALGKSITGGHVYRGSRLPELRGSYLYADYVSGQIWGLQYDEKQGRVTANRTIRERGFPVLSFGEDEKGEVYFLTTSTSGQGIHWFVKQGNR